MLLKLGWMISEHLMGMGDKTVLFIAQLFIGERIIF